MNATKSWWRRPPVLAFLLAARLMLPHGAEAAGEDDEQAACLAWSAQALADRDLKPPGGRLRRTCRERAQQDAAREEKERARSTEHRGQLAGWLPRPSRWTTRIVVASRTAAQIR